MAGEYRIGFIPKPSQNGYIKPRKFRPIVLRKLEGLVYRFIKNIMLMENDIQGEQVYGDRASPPLAKVEEKIENMAML